METELDSFRSWCNEVRAAEGGKEIIECNFVRQVDDRKAQAPPVVVVTVEEIVVAHCHIKQIPRFDTGRIEVGILGTWRWDVDSR